jgi:hypothetical protein
VVYAGRQVVVLFGRCNAGGRDELGMYLELGDQKQTKLWQGRRLYGYRLLGWDVDGLRIVSIGGLCC